MSQSSRLSLEVRKIHDETPNAYTIFFENQTEKSLDYLPGQYITLILDIDGEEHRRAYSLSSAPDINSGLAITVKRVAGGLVSNYLRDELKVGDSLDILKPDGVFAIRPSVDQSRHYLLFAAGSGITPIFSMIKTVLHKEPLSRLTLWYGNRTEDSIIFREELQKIKQEYPNRFEVYHYLSRPSKSWKGRIGWVNHDTVYQEILDLFMVDEYRKKYFICGPSPMMSEVYDALEKHAVHPSDIHTEYFNVPLKTEEEQQESNKTVEIPEFEDREVEINLDGQSHTVHVKAETDILSAAIEAGLDPPYACRSGLCISCKAEKKSGEIYMSEWIGLSEEEVEKGLILSCQAKPLSDDVSIDFDA